MRFGGRWKSKSDNFIWIKSEGFNIHTRRVKENRRYEPSLLAAPHVIARRSRSNPVNSFIFWIASTSSRNDDQEWLASFS